MKTLSIHNLIDIYFNLSNLVAYSHSKCRDVTCSHKSQLFVFRLRMNIKQTWHKGVLLLFLHSYIHHTSYNIHFLRLHSVFPVTLCFCSTSERRCSTVMPLTIGVVGPKSQFLQVSRIYSKYSQRLLYLFISNYAFRG